MAEDMELIQGSNVLDRDIEHELRLDLELRVAREQGRELELPAARTVGCVQRCAGAPG